MTSRDQDYDVDYSQVSSVQLTVYLQQLDLECPPKACMTKAWSATCVVKEGGVTFESEASQEEIRSSCQEPHSFLSCLLEVQSFLLCV